MSTLKADTIQSTSGGAVTLTKQSAAKAFSFFTGAASLSKNLNVSSITDVATGKFTVNFANSFDSANYNSGIGTNFTVGSDSIAIVGGDNGNTTSSAYRVHLVNSSFASYDVDETSTTHHGDLA